MTDPLHEAIKISFLGDIMLGMKPPAISEGVSRHLSASDLVVGNLEGPLTEAPPRLDKHRPLHTPPKKASALGPMHLDIAILANNHIMDHGVDGLRDTKAHLDRLGIRHLGAAECVERASTQVVVPVGGWQVGIMAFCHDEGPMAGHKSPGPNPLTDLNQVKESITALKRQTDIVIISYHGGEEFISVPWKERRTLFDEFQRFGADIVYAHHAHVSQGYLVAHKSLVLYGVGNFYMDTPYQRNNPIASRGAIFDVTFCSGADSPQVTILPVYADLENSYLDFAPAEQSRRTQANIAYSSRCIAGEADIEREWCRQAYGRFNGRYGLVGTVVRMLRYGLRLSRQARPIGYIASSRRDRSILCGALKFLAVRFFGRNPHSPSQP